MKRTLFSCIIVLALVQPIFAQTKEQVFKKVWKAVGGKTTFEKSRYLQFTFASERNGQLNPGRNHTWDRYTGDYRFESKAANGKTTTVLFNINTQQGKAYEDGVLLPDTTSTKLVKRGYASFINDTYWLMIPVKLQDPGVNTFLEPEETINEVKCQVIRLNFDKVGLTPGDQYWVYVNDKTGEIIRWKFLLQGQTNTSVFDWSPYVDLGNGLKLSTNKLNKEGKFAIVFPVAKVLATVEKDKFLKP
jgi:hypothetical protein